MAPAARWLEELRARLQLTQKSPSLLVVVAESDNALEEARRALVSILTATPIHVEDLGTCEPNAGPGRWAEMTRSRAADAYVLMASPIPPFGLMAFAGLLNAERELLRGLAGPVVLLISRDTERVLRKRAPDFMTWAAQVIELPRFEALVALARELGGAPEVTAIEAEEEPIRFLHISDLHLRPQRVKRFDQDRVLRGLLDLLEADRASFSLDLVFVTGDLGHGGKTEEYGLVVEFLQRLMAATGVPPERLFVVPGNHDVDRDVGRWLLRTLPSDEESIRFFEEEQSRQFHARKFEAYGTSLSEVLGAQRPLGLTVGAQSVEIVTLRGARVAVASFNSAWFALADDDHGKLWLGEACVDGAEGRIAEEKGAFAIALMHHPFSDLHEIERSVVEHRCERVFDLVLRGHLHQERTRAIASQRGGFVEVAAPAAYQGSHWPNGCFLGEIRPHARSVRLRPYTFSSGADPWVLDMKVFPDSGEEGYCHTFKVPEKKRLPRGMSKSLQRAAEATVGAMSGSSRTKLALEMEGAGLSRAGGVDLTKGVTQHIQDSLGVATARVLADERGGAANEGALIPRSDPEFLEKALLRAAPMVRDTVTLSGVQQPVKPDLIGVLFQLALTGVVEGPLSSVQIPLPDHYGSCISLGSEGEAPENRAVILLFTFVPDEFIRDLIADVEITAKLSIGNLACVVHNHTTMQDAVFLERFGDTPGPKRLILWM